MIELSDYDNYIYRKMIDELGGVEVSDISQEFDYYLVDFYCKDEIVEILDDKPCLCTIYIQYCYYFNYKMNVDNFIKGSKAKISKKEIYNKEINNISNFFTFSEEKSNNITTFNEKLLV